MKNKLAIFLMIYSFKVFSQITLEDSLLGFSYEHLNGYVGNETSKKTFTNNLKRNYIKNKYDLVGGSNTPFYKVDSTAGCGNLDFENGNTNGWAVSGDFQITSGSGYDPYGCFPVVCPGGNYSIKLNDDNTSGSKINFTSSLTKTIPISASNSAIKINYAGCLLDFPHPTSNAAFFYVSFFDQSNNPIYTQTLNVCYANPPGTIVATPGVNTYISPVMGINVTNSVLPVSVFPWQSKLFHLGAYIGQNITLKIEADWCSFNIDWGYAYFDICCNNTCPNPPAFACGGNFCTSLPYLACGPGNMVNYSWVGPGGPISTNSCITVNSSGAYSLTCYSVSNPTLPINSVYNINVTPSVNFSLATSYCNSNTGIILNGLPAGGIFSGGNISGNIFTPNINGINYLAYNYTDPITGCFANITQTTNVSACTGINEVEYENNDLKVSPNPFSNQIRVINNPNFLNSTFVLFDLMGKEIIRKILDVKLNSILIDDIPKGIYFYSLFNENQLLKSGKLLKE